VVYGCTLSCAVETCRGAQPEIATFIRYTPAEPALNDAHVLANMHSDNKLQGPVSEDADQESFPNLDRGATKRSAASGLIDEVLWFREELMHSAQLEG